MNYHRPVRIYPADPSNLNKKKLCVYCQHYRIKTKSGWRPNTTYKCDICGIALCVGGERNCFYLYHTYGLKPWEGQ